VYEAHATPISPDRVLFLERGGGFWVSVPCFGEGGEGYFQVSEQSPPGTYQSAMGRRVGGRAGANLAHRAANNSPGGGRGLRIGRARGRGRRIAQAGSLGLGLLPVPFGNEEQQSKNGPTGGAHG
jgi:hypothetical protein